MKFGSAVMCAALAAATCVGAPVASADSSGHTAPSPPGKCRTVTVPVSLSPGRPDNESISGTLCEPDQWTASSHQIDILVPGYSYNRSYWQWPQDPALYSFVDKDLAAGRATFAYDRLGDGASSRPPSIELTPASDAYGLHQIIGRLHDSYPQVNVIGHSYGSYVVALESNTYNDANRLVLTGLLHSRGVSFVLLQPDLHPARLDPRLAGQDYDLGYVTTRPGTRGALFYHDADPTQIAYDEAHKDVGGETQLAVALRHFIAPPGLAGTTGITRPTLLIDGQEDAVFCGITLNCTNTAAVRANETPYYPRVADLNIVTVPDTGHDLALHPTADRSFAAIDQWITAH